MNMKVSTLEPVVRECCTKSTDECFEWLQKEHGFTQIGEGDERFLIRVGTMPIVGVCHLDTVLEDNSYEFHQDTNLVICSELDDRLGLASLLLLADRFDFTIVCCDNEECGRSTADYAATYIEQNSIPVNWIFELDRRGMDVVSYDYSETMWDSMLEEAFGNTGYGSFSDICKMEDLGVKGFNAAIGYHNEHTWHCHADLSDTCTRIEQVADFIDKVAYVRLPHTAKKYGKYSGRWDDDYIGYGYGGCYSGSSSSSSTNNDDDDDFELGYPSGHVNSGTQKIHEIPEHVGLPSADSIYQLCDSCGYYELCEDIHGFNICEDCKNPNG